MTIEGDLVTVVNWSAYQDPKGRVQSHKKHRENSDCEEINKTPPTKDQPPSTNHQPPRTKNASAFVRPTLAEVEAYCRERGNNVNPQTWYDHYQSNGWRVGRNPMRDWKAAVRKWEQSDYAKPKSTTPRSKRYQG